MKCAPRPASTPQAERFDFRFDPDAGTADEREILGTMLRATREFCAAMQQPDREPYILSLLGKQGCGKTLLCKGIARFFSRYLEYYEEPRTGASLSRRGGRVEWRKVCAWATEGDFRVVEDLETDWLVMLDDVGAQHESASGLSYSILDRILNQRTERRWTVLTSNLSLEELARIDPRIASRLKRGDSVVITIPATVRDYTYRKERRAA